MKSWRARSAFTAIEMMVTVAVLSIIVVSVFQAVIKSKRDSEQRAKEADAKILNDAVLRVQLEGDSAQWLTLSNILYVDEDADAAIEFLKDNNYVQMKDKK